MFGYVTINRRELKVKDLETYESYYCGLCRVLRRKYGVSGAVSLNYDMAFLGLLFSGLYEDREEMYPHRCLLHPGHRGQAVITASMEYAADMNYMLAYHAHADNWRDEHRLTSLNMIHMMNADYRKLAGIYPRQHKALAGYVRQLHICEAENNRDIEAAANLTGQAMAEIYDWKQDVWEPGLRQMGFYMGKFIYLMDAYDDVEKDIRSGNYNPLKDLYCREDFARECAGYLELIMSRCCRAFETLPIIENADILRNILYAGVWMKYADVTSKRQKRAEGKEK